jgi:hypothetical protein
MTLEERIDACRARTGDTSTPPLWSDVEWTLFLNEADAEVAERSLVLLDTTTGEVCEIAVEAGTATYDLHASILKIQRAKLDDGRVPLVETSIEELDEGGSWEAKTGQSGRFFQSSETTLTLVPIPIAADTLRLRVYRLPLELMAADGDVSEIPAKYHYRAMDWALRCAYLKQDVETLDKGKAAEHDAIFTASFGQRPDANVQRKRRDRRTPVVRMSNGW